MFDMRRALSSFGSGIVATLGFGIAFSILGLLSESFRFQLFPVFIACFAFLTIDVLVVNLVDFCRSISLKAGPEIQPSPWKDEPQRVTFHWSLTHGVIVCLLVPIFYLGLAKFLAEDQIYYVYLLIALMPFSPWFGKMALEYDHSRILDINLIPFFFHKI